MSTKTGIAPQYSMAATLATNVNGTVMTSSPGPMPAARSARCSALVPVFTPTAYWASDYAANSSSKALTFGPRTKCCDSRTSSMASRTSSLMLRYWALRSTNGTISGHLQWAELNRPAALLERHRRGFENAQDAQTGDAIRQRALTSANAIQEMRGLDAQAFGHWQLGRPHIAGAIADQQLMGFIGIGAAVQGDALVVDFDLLARLQ